MHSNNLLSTIATQSHDSQLLQTATITGYADHWFLVQGSTLLNRVRCAASCLIKPEVGDTVLVYAPENSRDGFVLSVLIKVNPSQGCLNLPGGAALECTQGNLNIKAKELALHSTELTRLQTPSLNLSASQAQMHIKQASGLFQSVDIQALRISTTVKVMTTVAKRLIEKVVDSLRWVDQVDQTHAGRVRTKVEGHFHVQSRHTTMRSEGHVRIDGNKINLG
jgi:hypothetical protein